MRKLLIGAVVAVCAGGLGLWVSNNNARALSASVDEQAQSIVAGAMHQVEAVVSGRDIQVTGLVDSEAERDALLGALGEIESLGNIEQSLEILPIAKPFTLAATLKNGQTLLQGNVPTEEMRAILAQSGAAGADGLTLASGAPDRWESAIGAGLAALSNMEEGSVSLNGTEMRLTGLVALPDDRDALISALALPQGFTLQNVIETKDDGRPVAYEINFDAANGILVSGKLPKGLEQARIGELLGVSNVSGEAETGLIGNADEIVTVLGALKPWLAKLESARLSSEENALRLSGVTKPAENAETSQTEMSSDVGGLVQVSLKSSFTIVDFQPSLQSCTTQTDQLSSALKISFQSGSPNLAPESEKAVTALATIMGRCIREAGLTAELGGHTDNRGSGNYELSAARAQVVRAELIARGIRGDALSAVGFGPSNPIADNASEEGRAANRRMTVLWSQN